MWVPFPHSLKQEAGASSLSLVPPLLLGLPALVCRGRRRQKSAEVHWLIIQKKKDYRPLFIIQPASTICPFTHPTSIDSTSLIHQSTIYHHTSFHPKLHSYHYTTVMERVKLYSFSTPPSFLFGKSKKNEAWTQPNPRGLLTGSSAAITVVLISYFDSLVPACISCVLLPSSVIFCCLIIFFSVSLSVLPLIVLASVLVPSKYK